MHVEDCKNILILGGTEEAADLARQLGQNKERRVITSYAGRTKSPLQLVGEMRTGGFGGAAGLAGFLASENIDLLIDATHPFATTISANAWQAAELAGVRIELVTRPCWQPKAGDLWTSVNDLDEAASALPPASTPFLALGHQHLDAFTERRDMHFIVRMIDEPAKSPEFASFELVLGHAGKDAKSEIELFRTFGVSHLVCRNSGGKRGKAKLAAARTLALQVIMVERPAVTRSKNRLV